MKKQIGAHNIVHAVHLLIFVMISGSSALNKDAEKDLEPWQQCDVFIAPTNTSAGWGAFAARDFEQRELLDMTPLYVPLSSNSASSERIVKSTVLDDYAYGVTRAHTGEHAKLVLFGYDMIYNHHPTDNNVQLGMGPGYSQGWYTKRKIHAGEELYSTYGQNDGGKQWFEARGLDMRHETIKIQESTGQLEFLRSQYCTKIYSGPGRDSYLHLIPLVDKKRVAPFDAGFGDARAKVSIKIGERIEQSPGMIFNKVMINGSALGGLIIAWDHLRQELQETIRKNHPNGQVPVQYAGPQSQWQRVYRRVKLEDIVILPFAGRIGMVKRVPAVDVHGAAEAKEQSNCRLDVQIHVVEDAGSGHTFTSVILELVATNDIEVGQVLVMDVQKAGNLFELELLKSKIEQTGQLYSMD